MIPAFFELVDRNGLVIKPKKPFFDWHNSIYKETPIYELDEPALYLANLEGNSYGVETWMEKNFDRFFKNELNDWVIDQTMWPKKRTFKMFNEWFDYDFYDIVLDTENQKIKKF